jgi:hypothetical protein
MMGNPAFVRLWLSQFASLAALYGLNFAAVMQMEQATHSSARTGLVIVAAILPAFLASLLAGAVVDRRDRVGVLMACHLARAPVALAFWLVVDRLPPGPALAALLAINATLAALSQFATPAELTLLPDLVGRERLMAANALLQLSTLAAEGVGIVLLGSLLFRLGHLSLMGMLGAGLYLVALVLVIPLPRGRIEAGRGDRPWLAALAADLRGGWRTIAGDPLLRRVTAQVTLAAALLLVLVTLLPGLAVRTLGLGADAAAFLLLPGGVGFGLGAALVGWRGERWSRPGWVNNGLVLLGLALGLVTVLSGWQGGPALALLAGSILLVGGALALVIVPARTILQERPPAEARGRVIAAQLALGNAVAVLPVPLGGALGDWLGIRPVMGALALLALGMGAAGVHHVQH